MEVRASPLSPQHPFPPCPWATSLGPLASHPKTQPLQHPLATAPFPTAPTVSGGTLRPQKHTTSAFPTQGNRLALLPQTGGRSWKGGGDRGGQGRPRRRRAQTQCCHSRGRAVGPGPSCPDTIGAAPARHLCALCARQPPTPPPPPPPLLSVPHRIMDPLCVLGWTRTLFRRKKLCLSVRRDRPRKGRGGAVAAAGQRPSPLPAALALRGPRSGIQNPNGAGGKKSSMGSLLSPIVQTPCPGEHPLNPVPNQQP